ncbi:MAG: hypothetical protein R3202_03325, partial [Candidatus Competibacterales bacterium]|nr:hypothetical protein [Candidatus Competibacterales bacterium]
EEERIRASLPISLINAVQESPGAERAIHIDIESLEGRLYDLEAGTAEAAARELYDHEFEHAVCAAGVAVTADGFETAVVNE